MFWNKDKTPPQSVTEQTNSTLLAIENIEKRTEEMRRAKEDAAAEARAAMLPIDHANGNLSKSITALKKRRAELETTITRLSHELWQTNVVIDAYEGAENVIATASNEPVQVIGTHAGHFVTDVLTDADAELKSLDALERELESMTPRDDKTLENGYIGGIPSVAELIARGDHAEPRAGGVIGEPQAPAKAESLLRKETAPTPQDGGAMPLSRANYRPRGFA